MKLGEALVKEGLITRDQLSRALERQVMFGCRLGTNLIEMRFVTDEELTGFLSRHYRVPAVRPEMIVSIPEEVLGAVTRETVEKYKLLPFSIDRKRLHAALLNPSDIREIDELRFVTGYDIIPYAITELRLAFALEKYYGIKRELRYISLSDPFSQETAAEERDSVEKTKAAFAEVRDTEEIAGLLIREAYRSATRVAVFIIKGGKIVGWKARGLNIEGFESPGNDLSIFSEVLKNRSYYRGPLLNVPGNTPLIAILSGTPQDVLLMPITVRDRAVALLYADNGNTSVLNANIGYLSRLASMAAAAFEIIILRKRIMDL